jgi:hypothetical protein
MALPAARAIRYNSSFRAADRSVASFRGFHYYRGISFQLGFCDNLSPISSYISMKLSISPKR